VAFNEFFEFSVELWGVSVNFGGLWWFSDEFLAMLRRVSDKPPTKVSVWFCFYFWYFRRGLPISG
jgi:hypothetical protein